MLTKGGNAPLPEGPLTVTLEPAGVLDVVAVLLTATGRVRSDSDLVFFNNPAAPGVRLASGSGVGITPAELPADVDRVLVAATLDGTGPTSFGAVGAVTTTAWATDGATTTFVVDGLAAETALVAVEVYRRGGGWKIRAVGQGYAAGLAGLATDVGVVVEAPEPVGAEPVPAEPDAGGWQPSPLPGFAGLPVPVLLSAAQRPSPGVIIGVLPRP